MHHFNPDCLCRMDSLLHHEFSSSLEKIVAERIASRESEWFPCMSHGLCSLQSAASEVQAKHIELELPIDALQI